MLSYSFRYSLEHGSYVERALIRCLPIAEVCNEGKNDVGKPCCQHGWRVRIDGEGGRYCLQHDIAKAERQTDT